MAGTDKPPATAAQRKAKERADKRARGLRPLEVWARPEHHPKIKALADLLGDQAGEESPRSVDGKRMLELQRDKYKTMADSLPAGSAAHKAAMETVEATQQAIDGYPA